MKFIGVFHIETPSGRNESFIVRPKGSAHFNTARAAENAATRMGHIKMQGNRKYPIGSTKRAYAQPVNVTNPKPGKRNSFLGI